MHPRSKQAGVYAAIRVSCLTLGLLAAAPSPLMASQQDCTRSANRYAAALNTVQNTLQHYSSCTAASAGRYDCRREFDQLKSAGDDYKDAVSDYRDDCK